MLPKWLKSTTTTKLDEGLIAKGYIDAHTEGFDALRDAVRELTPSP